jgi:hypothetical protein
METFTQMLIDNLKYCYETDAKLWMWELILRDMGKYYAQIEICFSQKIEIQI